MRLVWLFVAALVGACAGPVAKLPPVAAPAADPTDTHFEAELAEISRQQDWRSTMFGSRAPNPPNPKYAQSIPKKGTFRTGAIARIRAYHFESGASSPPFAKDGRLDGGIVPGTDEGLLSDGERDRVVSLLRTAEKATTMAVMRCDFDPHHVLVMFDEKDLPIAKVEVCLGCGELQGFPATRWLGGDESRALTEDEKKAFREILDAHGLGAWTYGENPRLEAAQSYAKKLYGAPWEPTSRGRERLAREHAKPSGAPAELTPTRVVQSERDRFCTWLETEMTLRNREVSPSRVTGTFECENGGPIYSFSTDEDGCNKMCDVPFARLESCMRDLLNGPEAICKSGMPKSCEGLTTCLPHVKWRR